MTCWIGKRKSKTGNEIYRQVVACSSSGFAGCKNWYNNQRKDLGKEFKLEVNKEIDYIGEFPKHYQRKYKELRQSLVNRFPYAVYYIVEEEKKQVVIFGVLHTSRNPDTVHKRRK